MSKTLYIDSPPNSIKCWYCGEECPAGFLSESRRCYTCDRHPPLDIEVLCVQHDVDSPNWFFNRIHIATKDFRLHWNFYSGMYVSLDKKTKLGCWESISLREWPPKFQRYPAEFIVDTTPEKLMSFFNLYRVWSRFVLLAIKK